MECASVLDSVLFLGSPAERLVDHALELRELLPSLEGHACVPGNRLQSRVQLLNMKIKGLIIVNVGVLLRHG